MMSQQYGSVNNLYSKFSKFIFSVLQQILLEDD